MAKFRRNHAGQKNVSSGMIRVFIFFIALIILLSYLYKFLQEHAGSGDERTLYEIPESEQSNDRYYIPGNSTGEIIHHSYYSLSYVEEYEQAEWVAYALTKKSIQIPNVERANGFQVDPSVSTASLSPDEYSNSGYTRGHLVPAGDMAFNEKAMYESFYMSNVSPQLEEFNKGIWNLLEKQVRDWAYNNDRLYVVTGPVLSISEFNHNQLADFYVPEYFYKVILDIDGKDRKGVGFLVPHDTKSIEIADFMMSIDEIEEITGFDFFSQMIQEELQQELESHYDPKSWPIKYFNTFR